MKKWQILLIFLAGFLLSIKPAIATDYQINNLETKIIIQNNYYLLIEEVVEVNFLTPIYGINRYLPLEYTTKILVITDEKGEILPYKISKNNLNKIIIIGDQNKTVEGKQIYRIKYLVKNQNKTEIKLKQSWGDQIINNVTTLESPYIKILDVKCGYNCQINQQKNIFILTNSNDLIIKIEPEGNKLIGLNIYIKTTIILLVITGIVLLFWFISNRKK